MALKTTELPHATIARICHIEKNIKVEQAAVTLATVECEKYIKDLMAGAVQFTKHRGGTMIMKKDVEAFLATQK